MLISPRHRFRLSPVDFHSPGTVEYLLRDEFSVDSAVDAVNGTKSTSGHTRTVTDTESKVSITGGALTFSGGKAVPAWGDPGIWYPVISRGTGKRLAVQFNCSTPGATACEIGFDANNSGEVRAGSYYLHNGIIYASPDGGAVVQIGTFSDSTSYSLVVVLRATGAYWFVKGGSYTNWSLLWISASGTTASLYPSIANKEMVFTSSWLRIPSQLWLPSPLLSDSLNRADGALGTSDGAGHTESTGIGSGGGGLAWIANVGTWAISTNKAMCTALSGGIGIATVDLSTSNVIHTVAATRSAGVVGGIIRYTDADNYIRFKHDGTNALLIKRVAGIETTKITGVAAYSAGADIRAVVDGSYLALYYNNALVGSVTDAAIPTGTRVGICTTDTGNSVDNVRTYARGTEGQYTRLNWY